MHEAEVRRSISENPLSFLRITRSEAEFEDDKRPTSDQVFARSRENLQDFINRGVFFVEDHPALYVYRLTSDGHSQTGVVACCWLDEYEQGLIKRHEKTRPDKVRDRTEHLLAVRAQTGLILLAFRSTETIRTMIDAAVKSEPIYDFRCIGDVQHTFWRIDDGVEWVTAFRDVPALYIADGHHRVESADLARRRLRSTDGNGNGPREYDYVLAGIFPAEDLRILAYNRAVSDLNGLSEEEFLRKLSDGFIVTVTNEKRPTSTGEIAMYFGGKWYNLHFAVNYIRQPDPVERLDVTILQNYILRPVLGISDERIDSRISFIGGRDSIEKMEAIVDAGEARVAFSLFPTSMSDLLEVSDRGEIMPPKSTWFDPKLKDGILIHLI
jgi:uncharacterized protein (DUF1015 family)